jgi:hypothetical protein
MKIKTYSEMCRYSTFEERYEYLRIGGVVGEITFGHSRYINQWFYTSPIWRRVRDEVILRDEGCDLGIHNREIYDRIIVHHIIPITEMDIEEENEFVLNPEFLISTALPTHNAIHFGDASLLVDLPIERSRHDTSPWLIGGY